MSKLWKRRARPQPHRSWERWLKEVAELGETVEAGHTWLWRNCYDRGFTPREAQAVARAMKRSTNGTAA